MIEYSPLIHPSDDRNFGTGRITYNCFSYTGNNIRIGTKLFFRVGDTSFKVSG